MSYYIGDYEVNPDTHELKHHNKVQKIEPQIFKLLLFFLENTDCLLSRDELMDKVWSPCIISDSALSAAVSTVRRAIGDTGKMQQCIKTVSGSGYRFIAKVICSEHDRRSTDSVLLPAPVQKTDLDFQVTIEEPKKTLIIPDKPSIAVMDFIDMGLSEKGSLLAYGLTVDINTALSRLSQLFVIARASSSSLSKLNPAPEKISQQLGVRYLVYAQIHYLPKRIKITLSIFDAIVHKKVLFDYLDRSIDDIFLLQQEIIRRIVTVADSTIEQAEIERASLASTESLTAWKNYHRGLRHIYCTTIENVETAQYFFLKSIILDTTFARAYAMLSYAFTHRHLLNITTSNNHELKKSLDYAKQSIKYSKQDAEGYVSLARVAYFSKKFDQSLQIIDYALQLNPSYFQANFLKGCISMHTSQNQQAQNHFDIAERISPVDPLQFSLKMGRAVAFFNQQKYDDAVMWSLRATQYPNACFLSYAIATACLQLSGQLNKAQHYASEVLKRKPDFSTELYQLLTPCADENDSARVLLIEAMNKAGLPKINTDNAKNNMIY